MRYSLETNTAFWNQVGKLVRSLVKDEAGSTPSLPSSAASAQPLSEAPPLAPDMAAFARQVRACLGEQGEAGVLYLINLDKIRQMFEAQGRWAKVAARVESICLQVIKQRLDPDDLFHSLPGPIFLIVFTHLQQSAARLKCAIIAEEIRRHLVGDDPTFKDLAVGAAIAQITNGDLTLDIINLTSEAERMIAAGMAVSVPTGLEAPEWITEEVPNSAFDNPWLVELGGAAATIAPHEWHYEAKPDCLPNLLFVYLPLWHVKHRAIGTFLCLPTLPVSRSQVLVGDAIFSAAPPALIAEMDIAVFEKVTEDLETLLASGKQAMLSLPVHFETLAHSVHRKRFLSKCAELSEKIRLHLSIELVDLPEEAPVGRIAQMLGYVRPYSRNLSVRTSLSQVQFDAFKEAGVVSVGVALGRESVSEPELFLRINRFTQAASNAGLRTYAFELRTLSITIAALGAGFDHISGQMIGSIMDAPDSAYRFDLADLYPGLPLAAR